MTLEGFEIEHWSCLKSVRVSGLPASGVIVLHGPNRRGKSSIVQALRAGLMDKPSTTSSFADRYPRGTSEKPNVRVTFRSGGNLYRVGKKFGTKDSSLAVRTASGEWKVESASAQDAHDRTCALVGGSKSTLGLHQLLWLTQAEFGMPDAKSLDTVPTQLRSILGDWRTPLDDRFVLRLRERWNTWFPGQRKPDRISKLKADCLLTRNMEKRDATQLQLRERDEQFERDEALQKKLEADDAVRQDATARLRDEEAVLAKLRDEERACQERLVAREKAVADAAAAMKELDDANAAAEKYSQAKERAAHAQGSVPPAEAELARLQQQLTEAEAQHEQLRAALAVQNDVLRDLRGRAERVAAKRKAVDDAETLAAAKDKLEQAVRISEAITAIEKYLEAHPAPDKPQLEKLQANRHEALRLRSEREAASMTLTLQPDSHSAADLTVDGAAAPGTGTHAVRRTAELRIPGWGRLFLRRGRGDGNLDQVEDQLKACDATFATAVALFGLAPSPDAVDELVRRQAECGVKRDELKARKAKLTKLAPKGLAPLQAEVRRLQAALMPVEEADPLPSYRPALDALTAGLKLQIDEAQLILDGSAKAIRDAETALTAQRRAESAAKEKLATLRATATARQEELERLPDELTLRARVQRAKLAKQVGERRLTETRLTTAEETLPERMDMAQTSVKAFTAQLAEIQERRNVIKGQLLRSEGLHAERAALRARTDELTRVIDAETLDRDAVDRLYALFDECRETQLGTLMSPVHDRVLKWMNVLDLGDYSEVRSSETTFLPESLRRRDGTAEFALAEESTGAQEQIGLLARLVLGSLLTPTGEPTVAILDDPLTHCDVGRLNKLRRILRRIAEGDDTVTPPAGPLQILIFTCHPEWFRDEHATVIDLDNPAVMTRY